jgi:hypothetical protein
VTEGRETASPVCSAKGCRADAAWVLAWNNPRLHTPDRRKTWTACDEHKESLTAFLEARGFLRETRTIADWNAAVPTPSSGSSRDGRPGQDT